MTGSSSDEPEESGSTDQPNKQRSPLSRGSSGRGVRVEPYDHSGRQSAVDALLHFPDGRVAALEVTSAAEEGSRQLYSLLDGKYATLPNPGEWMWSATVSHPRDLPELEARCGRIILLCEAAGIHAPHYAYELRSNPDIAGPSGQRLNFTVRQMFRRWTASESVPYT